MISKGQDKRKNGDFFPFKHRVGKIRIIFSRKPQPRNVSGVSGGVSSDFSCFFFHMTPRNNIYSRIF